jgi:hypothetical protein
VPFMSEQEANGRAFLAEHGCGLVARTTEVAGNGRITFVDRHGGPTAEPVVPAADLRRTVEEALADDGLTERAAYASADLARRRAETDLSALFKEALH